jgi:transcriptional regulator with XRE-family HTH domain
MNNTSSSREEYTMDIQPATSVVPEWTVGDRIRKARETLGLTREDLVKKAKKEEFSVRIIGNYECGITRPKDYIVERLSELLPMDYEWLLNGKTPVGPSDPDGGIPNNVIRLPGLDSNQEPIGEHMGRKVQSSLHDEDAFIYQPLRKVA